MMKEPTREQIQAETKSLSRDNLGPMHPEVMRKLMLDLGMTEEQAEQSARFAEEQDRKKTAARAKAS